MIPEFIKRPIRDLRMLKRSLPTYLYWQFALRNDPIFRISTVEGGLEPRPPSGARTPSQRLEVAQRVVAAYQRAAAEQAKQSSLYKVSNEWIPIYRDPLRPLLAALEKGDAVGLRDLLDNFFRSSISTGLCGLATDMADKFFCAKPSSYLRKQLLIDSVYRWRHLQKLVPGVRPGDLLIEDIGNPYGMIIDGKFVRNGADYQYYYAKTIAEMLDARSGRSTVAELGGGVGGFAYFVNALCAQDLLYINLDLPEILTISTYQLLNLFPGKRALLYGEVDQISSSILRDYDMAFLPSFTIESLATDSVEISFNSYSLAEMSPEAILNYTRHISRISSSAILHVNHISDAVVGADRFEFDKTKFNLTSRKRALWNLGRHLRCDEYEFLLRRRLP